MIFKFKQISDDYSAVAYVPFAFSELGSGKDMFYSLMNRLEKDGVEVNAIRGHWYANSGSSNFEKFDSLIQSRMPKIKLLLKLGQVKEHLNTASRISSLLKKVCLVTTQSFLRSRMEEVNMKNKHLQYISYEIKKGTNISEVLRALILVDESLSSHELSELVEEAFPSTNSELLQAIWHWEGKNEGGISDNNLDLMGKHYIQV